MKPSSIMRKHLILLAFMASCLISYSQFGKQATESRALRLKTKVKSVTVFKSEYKVIYGKRQAMNEFKFQKMKYNKSGDVIEDISYSERGTIDSWAKYENDKKGNALSVAAYNSDGSLISKGICKNSYDSLGRLKKILTYQDTTLVYKVDYLYDLKGNMVQANNFNYFSNNTNAVESFEKHIYDENGRRTKVEYYNNMWDYQSSETFKYDANGNSIEENNGTYISVSKYNPNGLLLEIISYDGYNKPFFKYRYVYEFGQ